MAILLIEDDNIPFEYKFRKFLFLAVAGLNVLLSGVLGPVFTRRESKYSDNFTGQLADFVIDALTQQFIGLILVFAFALVYYSVLWGANRINNKIDDSKWFALEKNPLYAAARFAGFVFLVTFGAFLLVFVTIFLLIAFHISVPIMLWIIIIFSFPFFKGVFKL